MSLIKSTTDNAFPVGRALIMHLVMRTTMPWPFGWARKIPRLSTRYGTVTPEHTSKLVRLAMPLRLIVVYQSSMRMQSTSPDKEDVIRTKQMGARFLHIGRLTHSTNTHR